MNLKSLFLKLFPLNIIVVSIMLIAGEGVAATGSKEAPMKLPSGVSQGWWQKVKEDIRKSEYEIVCSQCARIVRKEIEWHSYNRAHNLSTRFTKSGIQVVPANGNGSDWTWGLSLTGYGFDGNTKPVSGAILSSSKNRVEYEREGLTEWYINNEKGLEQGFTLHGRPEKHGEETWVVLQMSLNGDLKAKLTDSGNAIAFVTPEGKEAVHYSALHSWDASNRSLPSKFALTDSGIAILVDVENAIYPVTVDPLATTPDWTADGQAAYGWFGYTVASAGDTNGDGYSDVIVGAYGYKIGLNSNVGRAYVYYGSSTGLASTPAWIVDGEASSPAGMFGHSVASAGDVNGDGYSDVIVGADAYNGYAGRAYVYYGSSDGLADSASWTVTGESADDYFGVSVASAGDVNGDGYSDVIIGAYGCNAFAGRAYVYYGSSGGLSALNPWVVNGAASSKYGGSVASAGDVNGDGYSDVIVGAFQHTSYTGQAYIYHGSSGGLLTSASWTENGEGTDYFGYSVSSAGDVNGDGYSDVIVGAYANSSSAGRVYVYHGSSSGTATSPAITMSGTASSLFGVSVASAGDINGDGYNDIIVGAPGYNSSEGQTTVYYGSSTGISSTAVWTTDGGSAIRYGISVASAGDVNGDGYSDVIVGAHKYNSESGSESGRAYAYYGSADGPSATAMWTKEGEATNYRFGARISTAGDVNGDGYGDVIVVARRYSTYTGRVYLFNGSASGLSTTASWTKDGEGINNYFGTSASTAGDVNGDGYSDVIVGAFGYNSNMGRAYLYLGGSSGLSTTASWIEDGETTGDYFGVAAASAGDVNGDGYSDVIVGANRYSSATGRAYLYFGGSSGLSTTASWTKDGEGINNYFGTSASTAGDVNGDSYSDVIVAAHGRNTFTGRVYVFHGSSSGLSSTADWTEDGEATNNRFGVSASTAGDVNGDGYSDVIVGAQGYNSNTGRAYVYHGGSTGLNNDADWTATGEGGNNYHGSSVSRAGDVNGDGYSDIVVGAFGYNSETGRAYVYFGASSGLSDTADWTKDGEATGERFGGWVSTAGDVNGDGYSDILVGANRYSSETGRAYVYAGNGAYGLDIKPMQYRTDGTTPIVRLGKSNSVSSYKIATLGRFPMGRGKVKMEWEVKPLGTSFDGTGTTITDTWQDTGTTAHTFNESVTGLGTQTSYHWRARFRYPPGNIMHQTAGRWFSPFGNGWQETDLRTNPAPTVRSFSPTGGGTGTYITITGTNFTDATSVTVGGTDVTEFTVVSDTQIIAVVAANAEGKVTVTTGSGTAESESNFDYRAVTPRTYYVDIRYGSDSNDGSSGSPWKTLHHAVDQINGGSAGSAENGYVLHVLLDVTYCYSTDNGEANRELAISQNYVTIIGELGSKPTISGPSSGGWEYGIKITGSHVALKNLNITGFTREYKTGIEIVSGPEANSTNNTIENCRVYGNYDGISISNSDVFTIQDSEIDNNDFDGISISNCTTQTSNGLITRNTIHDNYEVDNSDGIIVQNCNPEISRNKIYDNRFNISLQASDDPEETTSPTIKNNLIYEVTPVVEPRKVDFGILMGGSGTVSPKIYHNTIDGGRYDGIYMDGAGNDPEIKYNIITDFGQYGIENSDGVGSPIIVYNDLWNNTLGSYSGGTISNTNITQDPLYGSYTLQSESPCINKIPIAAEDPVDLDYDGFNRPRPGETEKDMGAYEYVADENDDYSLPGGTGAVTDYRMFTVPLKLGTGADMLSAMEKVLGSYDPTRWRAFLYTGTSYREFNSTQFAEETIKPGMGFWIITTYSNQIPYEGRPAPDGVDYVINLQSGWHIIGLPWTGTRISLGNISVTDGVYTYALTSNDNNLTQPYVWDYTGSGAESGYVKRNTSGYQLEYNKGYLIKVLPEKYVKLIIPLSDNQGQNAFNDTNTNQTSVSEDDESPPPSPGEAPFPDIKVNGQDGPVSVAAGNPVSVSINLDPGGWNGRNADWWVAAHTPFDPPLDWYTYVYPEGWRYGIHVCVQTPLFELVPTSPYKVLDTVLPVGNYIFYFAVDGNMDGEPDVTWLDAVEVQVK